MRSAARLRKSSGSSFEFTEGSLSISLGGKVYLSLDFLAGLGALAFSIFSC